MSLTLGVVIPTCGRPEKVVRTLQTLFKSDVKEIPQPIPVVVVDDGSQPPIESILFERVEVPPAFTLRYIYQENAGPGAARNAGFKAVETDIILFLDDDIDLLPDALYRHYSFHASEGRLPCVLYGAYPSHEDYEHYRSGTTPSSTPASLIPTSAIASGHISMLRAVFKNEDLPYSSHLKTPVAEEYEMAYRLQSRAIPIFLDPTIVGLHNIPLPTLSYLTAREYRHGMALGELLVKAPHVLSLSSPLQILKRHHPYRPRLSLSWLFKAFLAHTQLYRLFLRLYVPFERPMRNERLSLLARLITGAAIMHGIKNGIAQFSQRI